MRVLGFLVVLVLAGVLAVLGSLVLIGLAVLAVLGVLVLSGPMGAAALIVPWRILWRSLLLLLAIAVLPVLLWIAVEVVF